MNIDKRIKRQENLTRLTIDGPPATGTSDSPAQHLITKPC